MTCSRCGNELHSGNFVIDSVGETFCVTCAAPLHACNSCGRLGDETEVPFYPNRLMYLCHDCAVCPSCGETIAPGEGVEDSTGTVFCDTCAADMLSCDYCGRLGYDVNWSDEHDMYLCPECLEKNAEVIHGYHHGNVLNIAKGDGRWIGTELELEFDDHFYAAEECYDNERNEHFEFDGSVCEGFETVTHIMTLGQHREWATNGVGKKLMEMARNHQDVDVGLHVNVSIDKELRADLGDFIKAAVYYFVSSHPDSFRKLGRRWSTRFADFGARAFLCETDKYDAVNLKYDRIEFRFFHTTTNAFDYIGSVEVAHAIVEWVSDLMFSGGVGVAENTVKQDDAFYAFWTFVDKHYEVGSEYMHVYMHADTVEPNEVLEVEHVCDLP